MTEKGKKMPLMTNAEAFRYDFGIYATELWAMTEAQFLEWLNADCDRERPVDMVVRCKDCQYRGSTAECLERDDDWFCADGKRREDEK